MPYFSPSTGGFYDLAIHVAMPEDVVSVTAEEHAALVNAQAAGMLIVPGPDGAPVAIHQPLPSADQVMINLRAERDARLSRSDWTQMPDAPLTETQRQTWRVYRQALRDLPETTADLNAVTWPAAPA